MPKHLTTSDFINRAREIHGELYDYSQVVYDNMHGKVKIIDPEYGEFYQSPMGHLHGQGHPCRGRLKAANSRKMPLKEFIERAREKHGNLYDYSKVVYENVDSKVCIIDPDYGEFWQSPYQHLNSHGCPARTANKEWLINHDHIIPLSIIHSSKRKHNDWNKERPLFKFLDSDVNLKPVSPKYNKEKSDLVTINGRTVSASSIRNNYEAIGYLIKEILGVDAKEILDQDQKYVRDYLGFFHK